MSDQISPEVVAEILLRSEPQTILRCRCVCKEWRDMIDNPYFINQQINYSIKTSTNYSLYLKPQEDGKLFTLDLDSVNAYQSFNNFSVPFISGSFIGSCNGLLCLRNEKNEDILIVNPFTRKDFWVLGTLLADFHSSRKDLDRVVWTGYGFGYDHVVDDYKVVRIAEIIDSIQRTNRSDYNVGLLESEIVICYVKTSVVRVVKMPYHTRTTQRIGVLVNGALHWMMGRFDDKSSPNLIVGYDLGSSEFVELPQPDFTSTGFRVDIGVFETWLCIFAVDDVEMCFHIWVMKEYGVKESWTKLCSIPHIETCYDFTRPLSFWKKGSEVLLELDDGSIVWYDMEQKRVKDVLIQMAKNPYFETIICLRSLASVPYKEGEMVEIQ